MIKKFKGGKEDLTNQKFGRWTLLYPVDKGKYKYYWHCRCDCGNEKDVLTTSLKNGSSTSCGCYRKEYNHNKKMVDMTGQKIGKLTIIRPLTKEEHNDKTNEVVWECKCDCGKICHFRGSDLRLNKIMSCGCMKSKGEYKIEQILKNNNISYKKHITFSDCKYNEKEKERGAEFDFIIYYQDNFYLIEYDGVQHFKPKSEKGWNNQKNFDIIKIHDKIKTNYCIEHNIPLIRIPYTQYEKLNVNDLLLSTSDFVIKEGVKDEQL